MTNLTELQNSQVNAKFFAVTTAMQAIVASESAQFQQLYKNILYMSSLLQSVSGQLASFIQQKQFNRMLTLSYWTSSAANALVSDEVPLVSMDGLKPQPLQGDALKALVDTVLYVYSNGSSAVTAVQMNFFADSYLMLNMSRPWTTLEQLITWMGASSCIIRANLHSVIPSGCSSSGTNCTSVTEVDWTSSIYSNVTNYCIVWVEETTQYCQYGYNAQSNTCSGPSHNSTRVLLSAPDWWNTQTARCYAIQPGSNVSVTSVQLSKQISFVHQNSTCALSVQDRLMNQAVGTPDEIMIAITYVWASYMSTFQTTLRSLELIAFGTLPNGIKTEIRALGYAPVPDGYQSAAQQVQCMRGYWLSVHPSTLPITSLTFDSVSSDTDNVQISIASSPPCANNSNACYTVQNSDLRVNFAFQAASDVTVPAALAVVGDVTSPLFSGLYDVPAALIETTNNPLVRSNLLTYLLMPAGTAVKQGFDYFFTMTRGLFDAYVGSASAADYKFPVVLDNDGYPVCNVASGLPVSATYTAPVDNCVPPYVWSGPSFTPVGNAFYESAPPVQSVASCAALTAQRLPGIIDGKGPIIGGQDFSWTTPSFSTFSVIVFSTLSQYGSYSAASSLSDYTSLGIHSPAAPNVYMSPPAWSVSAWLTPTASIASIDSFVTLLDQSIVLQTSPPSTHRVAISIGYPGTGFQYLQQSVVITLDGSILWVPSSNAIAFQINTPVFLTVVFIMGVQASYNDVYGPYRIQLYVNGALVGSAIRSTTLATYNYNDNGLSSSLTGYGGVWQLSQSTASVRTTSLVVENVKFWGFPLSSSAVKQEFTCGLAAITPRCWLPPVNGQPAVNNTVLSSTYWTPSSTDAIVITDQALPVFVLQKSRPACISASSGLLLSVSAAYDSANGSPYSGHVSALLSSSSYSFTFWMKFLHNDYPIVYEDTFGGMYLSRQFVLSVFSTETPANTAGLYQRVQAVVQGDVSQRIAGCVEFQLPDQLAGTSYDYSFYGISVAGNTATLTVNGVTSTTATGNVCGTDLANSIYSSLLTRFQAADPVTASQTQSYRGFWDENSIELLYYYSAALSQAQIATEMECQLNSYSISDGEVTTQIPSKFILPLAVCELQSLDASSLQLGYCRHSAMCGGNCAVYASVDLNSRIFTARQIVCDPGWLTPDCQTRCTSVDSNGMCTTQQEDLSIGEGTSIAGLPTAYSLNGYWCQILKNYQVAPYAVNGQSYVSLSYRSYKYLADVTIPSGTITTVVPAGNCPALSLQPNGDSSFWISFTNLFAEYTTIRITTASAAGCVNSAATPCCDNTYSLTLPPYATVNWPVPTLCSQLVLGVDLDLGNGYQSCTSLNSTTVASRLAESQAGPVQANVQRSIVVTGNDVLTQLTTANQQLATLTFTVIAQVAQAAANGIDLSQMLTDTAAAIAAMPTVTSDPTYLTNLTDLFATNALVAAKLAQLAALNNATQQAIADQAAKSGTLADMTDVYTKLSVQVSASTAAQQTANTALQAQISLTNQQEADAVQELNNAYADLHAKIQNMTFGVANSGLSAAMFALIIVAAVFGILGFLLAAVPLVVKYGPGCWAQCRECTGGKKQQKTKSKQRVKSSSDSEGRGSSASGSSGSGSGSGSSGSEQSDEETQSPKRQSRLGAAGDRAFAETRLRMQNPHH